MAFGTHIISLIQKQQQNRGLKKAHRRYYKKYSGSSHVEDDTDTKQFNSEKFTEKSEDEKKNIRKAVKADLSNEVFKSYLKTMLVLFILSAIIYLLMA